MERGENHEPPRFCIEVNVPRGGYIDYTMALPYRVLLRLLVGLHCKTGHLDQLSGVNIFRVIQK